MAVAHGKDNIRINCICPGTVQTEVWEPMIERNPRILDEITPWYPLGRIGKPIDIANAALFLASDEANFATGAVFAIDGVLVIISLQLNCDVYKLTTYFLQRIDTYPRNNTNLFHRKTLKTYRTSQTLTFTFSCLTYSCMV